MERDRSTPSAVAEFLLCHPAARVPARALDGDAGYDLAACESWNLPPGRVTQVRTGVCMALPDGLWARLTGRSSMAARALYVFDAVIDNGYRGELIVTIHNRGVDFYHVKAGDRIAQLVLHRIESVEWKAVAALRPSERGDRGWGSTGH